ncbi:WD40 repeat domain-containing protein [Streptosporangium amethystogenes subsp. fukuiense]|uniref:WD40 repeat domain-containing protein n=1 Tax=Streptosporangium amethystogenes subsp. fukuiense TaxID=698418 RepID=A0ABW2SYD8_9ACTN
MPGRFLESGRPLPADLGDRQAWDAAYHDLPLRMAGAAASSWPTCSPPPASPDHGIARKVLDRFVRARLVSVDEDRAEITHEALTHAWPQLRTWIQTDRATLLVRRQLDDDAREWLRHGRDPAFLYRGTRLAGLTEASPRWEYASTFGAELTEVPLLAATAWSVAPTPEARRALITTTPAPARAVFSGHTGRVNAVAISPKGGIVAGGGDDGTVRLWDMATGRAVGRPMTSPEELVNDLAFTRDGSLLVVASEVMTEDFSGRRRRDSPVGRRRRFQPQPAYGLQ